MDKDIVLGSTSYGIHKDDLMFTVNGVDVRVFGSQGQQRTASLSAKLAEIEIMREVKGKAPVLLLDDVFSELDEGRQKFLMKSIQGVQSIITCTGIEDSVIKEIIKKTSENDESRVFKVENGSVTENVN